jgi:hydrogenase expression/formation protein HypE
MATLLACPVPAADGGAIQLAHGGGGRLMHRLLESVVFPALGASGHDGALVPCGDQRLAFTTDSYIVTPLEFPGGDIGRLAVCGTVNDLAMCGARPLALSAAFILEEGLPIATFQRMVASMQRAAAEAGVPFVTGDTKVVDRGRGDGLFVNTAGIGVVEARADISPSAVRPGDAVIVSGDLGRHGVAIMAVREGLAFETTIESDVAPLWSPVQRLLSTGCVIHCLRDLTRGGLATALVEIATAARVEIEIDETAVPVREDVRGACELLGLDPLYVANEGRFVAFVGEADVPRALASLGEEARVIGRVAAASAGNVLARTAIGTRRMIDMLSGEQLPRIC